MNNISLIGRLTNDPEGKDFNGRSLVNFSIAVDNTTKSADGQKETSFYRITAWGGAGETILKFCKKGDLLGINGSLNPRHYVGKNGEKGISLDVSLNSFTLIPNGRKSNDSTTNDTTTNDSVKDTQDSNLPF